MTHITYWMALPSDVMWTSHWKVRTLSLLWTGLVNVELPSPVTCITSCRWADLLLLPVYKCFASSVAILFLNLSLFRNSFQLACSCNTNSEWWCHCPVWGVMSQMFRWARTDSKSAVPFFFIRDPRIVADWIKPLAKSGTMHCIENSYVKIVCMVQTYKLIHK